MELLIFASINLVSDLTRQTQLVELSFVIMVCRVRSGAH